MPPHRRRQPAQRGPRRRGHLRQHRAPPGLWELVAAHSGRCLAYRASGTVDVVQDWCNGSTAQSWTMQFLEDSDEKNRLQLRPVDAPNECLSRGGTPAGEEPTAYVTDCFDNMPGQEWRLALSSW
ncbi:RICIN domain-containing protein [Streptomyces sp. NPDC059556]|uniref:RICIN domain-containing protein n=1 Tax=Streptomyces sp. NPDC059556 TaxID=3346863 RepID=UPI0036B991DA